MEGEVLGGKNEMRSEGKQRNEREMERREGEIKIVGGAWVYIYKVEFGVN